MRYTCAWIIDQREIAMNWPTAFVISTIIVAGAFLYSDRSDAGIMGGGGMIAAAGDSSSIWQMREDNMIRICGVNTAFKPLAPIKGEVILNPYDPKTWPILCTPWSK
jgi:hypothetical protein